MESSTTWTRWGIGLALLAFAPSVAAAAGNVGVRYGWSDVGSEIIDNIGDLGGTNLIGLQASFDLLTLLEVEVAGEYVSESFGFTEGLIGGVEAAGDGDWEDLALYATGHLNVLTLPMLPVTGYVGGGLNVHWIDLKIENAVGPASAPPGPQDDFDDAVKEVAGESSETGWHVVGGLRLSFLGSPLSIFAEGRWADGFEDDGAPETKSAYLGVTLGL